MDNLLLNKQKNLNNKNNSLIDFYNHNEKVENYNADNKIHNSNKYIDVNTIRLMVMSLCKSDNKIIVFAILPSLLC